MPDQKITLTHTEGFWWWKHSVQRTYVGSGTVWHDVETGRRPDTDIEAQLAYIAWSCYDPSNSPEFVGAEEAAKWQERLNITTRLACEYCKVIEGHYGPRMHIPEWAQEWWEAHKKVDANRQTERNTDEKSRASRNRG